MRHGYQSEKEKWTFVFLYFNYMQTFTWDTLNISSGLVLHL